MPVVDSAEQATAIALSFLKDGGWAFPRAVGAHKENTVWVVQVDVGAVLYRVATVRIDASSGTIIDYNIPTSVP